jgi:hypothetical protein
MHPSSQNLIENNEQFHKMLVEGVRVNYTKNGEESGITDKQFIYYFAISNDFRDIAIKSMTGSYGNY